ncbi:MAG: 3-phosphoshikimate 1-carboxyvinyltransferase [Pseudomonadota bacterium]|nr:3-phosphoshikimate 1-carboxyvinyltransferase [Pseudomonadota bacterium]
MSGLSSGSAQNLAGDIRAPGDKSISHRALMIGAMAVGETTITGLLEGEDVRRTAAALAAMGVGVNRHDNGDWKVQGVGVGGLAEPANVLDMGNSGTGARLLMGLIATHPFTSHMTGDESLCRRPMGRIAEPIERMGAQVIARDGGRMPLAVLGAADPVPIIYQPPVASAQIKSAVLLAGLNTPGRTTVIEPRPSRDHTELMLRHFGAELEIDEGADGSRGITLTGQPELSARDVNVPGDPSSAAFPGVAALLVPGSGVTIRGVGLNPLRAGLFGTLIAMGADITIASQRNEAGEPVGDVTFRSGKLTGIDVPAERAPSMIDEYPILAVAAAFATGTTRMYGLSELRVKESDRLAAIERGLTSCGVTCAIEGDSLIVQGNGQKPRGGALVSAALDHRIAMSFLVLGLAAERPVQIDDGETIDTSFPGFAALMNGLGGSISEADNYG